MNVPFLIKTLARSLASNAKGVVVEDSGKQLFITTNSEENQGRIIGRRGGVIHSLITIARSGGYFLRLLQPSEKAFDEEGRQTTIQESAEMLAQVMLDGAEVEVDLEAEMIGFDCAKPENTELVSAIEILFRCIGKKNSVDDLAILWADS